MTTGNGNRKRTRLAVEVDDHQSLELLESQYEVLRLLVTGSELEDILAAVTTALERLLPGSRCSVWLLDRAQAVLRFGAAPSLPPDWTAYVDPWPIGPKAASCGTAAFLNERVVVSDISTDERWVDLRDVGLAHGLRACWSTPIVDGGGNVLGAFGAYYDQVHTPTPHEMCLVDCFAQLASIAIEHDRLFGALGESEERFRRAFEANAVGMALVDRDGRFLRVNQALCETVQRAEAELVGVDFWTILHPDLVPTSVAAIDSLARGESDSVELELECLRADGTVFPSTVTASALRAADGSFLGLCAHVLDVTQRQAAEDERRARDEADMARLAAETASRAKSEFLSAMSHELRTPLSAVVGFAELLETLDLDPERRASALRRISEAATHIVALVDDVLDIAKIEAEAIELEHRPVSLRPIVAEVLDLAESLALERRVTLSNRSNGRDVVVLADPRRVLQVVLNIVTNAIKYNRVGGRVTVSIREAGGRGVVRVTDTGPGVSSAQRSRLFVPFDRLGAERSGAPGSGLGLPLSKALTEAMNGTLTLSSRPGKGTTVEVGLPIAVPAGSEATGEAAATTARSSKAAARDDITGRILYVEDDPTSIELVAELFRLRPGVELVTCAHGSVGLAQLEKEHFDLVLLDLDLPDMTGEDFVGALSQDPALGALPVTIISGRKATQPLRYKTFRKPLDVWALLTHIDDRLGKRRHREEKPCLPSP